MARNIGESLKDQNIILETKEDKYKANQNSEFSENNNSFSQKNNFSINPNKMDPAAQAPAEPQLDTLNETITETLVLIFLLFR